MKNLEKFKDSEINNQEMKAINGGGGFWRKVIKYMRDAAGGIIVTEVWEWCTGDDDSNGGAVAGAAALSGAATAATQP